MDIIKTKNLIRLFYLILFVLVVSCTSLDSIWADDDGFTISIRNYTNKEYVSAKFYMGAFDVNNDYIAVDSLIYPDLTIYKNTGGTHINKDDGYSVTFPFLNHKNGLNDFGYWVPKFTEIEMISGERIIHFKAVLANQEAFNLSSFGNGTLVVKILQDGSVSW